MSRTLTHSYVDCWSEQVEDLNEGSLKIASDGASVGIKFSEAVIPA